MTDSYSQSNPELFKEAVEESDGAENTKRNLRIALNQFGEWLENECDGLHVYDVNPDHMGDFLDYLEEDVGNAPSTVGTKAISMGIFYTYLMDQQAKPWHDGEQVIEHHPTQNLSASKKRSTASKKRVQEGQGVIEWLPKEDIRALVENVPKPVNRNQLLIRMQYQTGMRAGELRTVKLDSIKQAENKIEIYNEKGDKDRTVAYQPELNNHIDEYRRIYRPISPYAEESPYLFVSRESPQLSKGRINRIVKQAAENAGIQRTIGVDSMGREQSAISSHVLRHSFAMSMLERGAGIYELKELLGHADISTTETYVSAQDSHLIDAVEQFGPSLNRD